mgnify:CR=1 FL=1
MASKIEVVSKLCFLCLQYAHRCTKLLRDAVIRGSNPHLVGRVEVINGKVEDEKIQAEALTYGKVDTIISEPIGVMLYHERMVRQVGLVKPGLLADIWSGQVESYLLARDLFLKPGGTLYPSAGSLYFAPFSDEALFLETEAKVGTGHFRGMAMPEFLLVSGELLQPNAFWNRLHAAV